MRVCAELTVVLRLAQFILVLAPVSCACQCTAAAPVPCAHSQPSAADGERRWRVRDQGCLDSVHMRLRRVCMRRRACTRIVGMSPRCQNTATRAHTCGIRPYARRCSCSRHRRRVPLRPGAAVLHTLHVPHPKVGSLLAQPYAEDCCIVPLLLPLQARQPCG